MRLAISHQDFPLLWVRVSITGGAMRSTRCMALAVGVLAFGSVMLGGVRADAVDPCSMLNPDKVAAALGVPEVKTPGGAKRCVWTPKKYAPGANSVTIQLMDEK